MEFSNGHASQAAGPQAAGPQDPRIFSANYINYSKPPPIPAAPSPSSSFNFDLSIPPPTILDMKTDDELFVETWLSKLGKINLNLDLESTTLEIKSSKPMNPKAKGRLSIHSAKKALKKCLEITSRLEATQRILKENVAKMCSDEWKRHTIEIGGLKDELTVLMTQFYNPDVLKTLKYDIAQRSKKRATQKRKRHEAKLQVARRKEENHAQHKKIDLWMASMKEEAGLAKAEEIMKKDADCVLADVTKKKVETRKQLSLLASLIKLRTVRETAAKARGEKIPDEDNAAFSKTTETLVKLWENSMKTYTKEELDLNIMLERSANEDDKQTKANKEKEIASQWDHVLFGPSYPPAPLFWALTSAQRDMEKFIAIRKSWDTFITSDKESSLKIPLGWVLPEANPTLEWSQYKQV